MVELLHSRVEDAGINASAPPEQRWLDGWLVRYSPAKAKRARCINALATGRLSLADRLRLAAMVFNDAQLPMLMRISPFSVPASLDQSLAALGWSVLDDTRVMVCLRLPDPARASMALPQGVDCIALDAESFAATVGALRGSPQEQRSAHAQRLRLSPVRYQGFALIRRIDGQVLACAQVAREAELVGLYDVFTHQAARNQGLATLLCERLLCQEAKQGATVGYLQVEADNAAARLIYSRLGFYDAYAYHYRVAPATS